jgi:hypothetical protein
VVGALVLAGVSVVFASQALGPGGAPGTTPRASLPTAATATLPPALAAAPEISHPEATLTARPSVMLTGRLVEELPRDAYRLRVYVNGELQRERRLPRRQEFELEVGLDEGANSITLAVAGPAGEGLHSAPVEITRDSLPPAIASLEPASGTTIFDDVVVLRGTSEPGATLRVTNTATGTTSSSVIGDDGALEMAVNLAIGSNSIALEARDAAGNSATADLVFERREGEPTVELSLSRTSMTLAGLPTSMTLVAHVLDAAGAPVEGAEVVFSLSPPGMPTLTFDATTQAGVARWSSVRISDAATAGQGLATVLVTLPDGGTLTSSAYFTITE